MNVILILIADMNHICMLKDESITNILLHFIAAFLIALLTIAQVKQQLLQPHLCPAKLSLSKLSVLPLISPLRKEVMQVLRLVPCLH